MKFTQETEQHESGMIRNSRLGKGRFDLNSPIADRRLAAVYEAGSQGAGGKYPDRNWEKGTNFSRFLDSALRHINQYRLYGGKRENMQEDHLAQAIFNLNALLHLEETHPEFNDLPVYFEKEE